MPHDEVRYTPSDQKGAVLAEGRVFPALSVHLLHDEVRVYQADTVLKQHFSLGK
jgi:hypothetical protein